METELEKFSFSRLPKSERIAQIIVKSLIQLGGALVPAAEFPYYYAVTGDFDFLALADEIARYAKNDFTIPYAAPVMDSASEIASDEQTGA